MYEYMRGLQRQFFKEPDFPELRQEIHEIHQALTDGKETSQRRGQHLQTKGWPLGGTLAQYLQSGLDILNEPARAKQNPEDFTEW